MAYTTTTLASALGVNDTSMVVTSATSFAAGSYCLIDQEWIRIVSSYPGTGTTVGIIRGVNGTATAAHATGANIKMGTSTDVGNVPPQTAQGVQGPIQRARLIRSYSLTGAISISADLVPGTDTVALLNGTTVRAMTLAVPTKDMDGDILTVIGNGKAAHTLTVAGGIGAAGAGYTVLTFDTGAQCSVQLMAANGVWVPLPSPMSGTLTAADVAVA